jgi:hypothetical protein
MDVKDEIDHIYQKPQYTISWVKRRYSALGRRSKIWLGIGVGLFVLISLLFVRNGNAVSSHLTKPLKGYLHPGWKKPKTLNVVALVFYGRRANVQILERYLRV